MADQIGKCNMNNTLLLQNAFSVNTVKKEECQENDFVDDKIQVSETAIITEVQDNLICDEIKQYDISNTLDNIKTELLLPEVQYDIVHDNLKIENGISIDNTKIEYNSRLLYCEDCHAYYQDYCAKCGMLAHILNRAVPIQAENISQAQLPNNILEIRDYFGESRIFALKLIPAGVRFGPFTGLNRTEHSWKIKGGKFVVSRDKSMYLNWMQYISPARNISEQNLLVFQYEDNLYYQSTSQIKEGDELLVYFGEEYKDSLNRNVEMNFIPATEHILKDAFGCTFCCLGFSSKSYLAKHKAICPGNVDGGFLIEELTQCPSCKIYLHLKEYIKIHIAYCRKIDDRKCILPTTDDLTGQADARKTPQYQIYKCQQCKYRTKYKGDLKNHTNHHYEVKMHKCELCCRRYKTKEVLGLHVESTHVRTHEKDHLDHSTGAYVKVYIKAEQSSSQNETKQLECSLCEFRTKYKRNLRRHTAEKHLKKRNYKCESCNYKANQRYQLKSHIETKHLREFKYKCDTCDYKTNRNSQLKMHIEAKHLKEFKYKCGSCDYKTNWKSVLKSHVQRRHMKEVYYNCDTCDYKTNVKSNLKKHKIITHLKLFNYKCDSCDYKANQRSHLKIHIAVRHLKEFKYKCEICDYKANLQSTLKNHIEARHLKEFKYKCDTCEYKANRKSQLKSHIQTTHLKEFKYKCDTCDYKTNRKSTLQIHIERIHLREYKYTCDACDYKASTKSNLMVHVKTKHFK